MSIYCGVHITGGVLSILNPNKATSFFFFEKLRSNNLRDIDNFFNWFNVTITDTIDYLSVLIGSEYNSEFRKKFLKVGEKQNKIKRITIIGVHQAKIVYPVAHLDILPVQGHQLWIFDIHEIFFYCTIWEYLYEQWRFKTTWQKIKTIKGKDSAPTINDLRELKSKFSCEVVPDILVYHEFSKVDENEFKEIFWRHRKISFENMYNWIIPTTLYGKCRSLLSTNKIYKCDILFARDLCIIIDNQTFIQVSSKEKLPYRKPINLKIKTDAILKVKEDGNIAEKIRLKQHESTDITLEIDVNGIYSLTIKYPEDNIFDLKKLYNIPKQLINYNRDFHAIGIDLGTTECCSFVIRRNGPEFVQIDTVKAGQPMPSYVIFDEAEPHCGYIAVDRMKNKSDYIVFDAKRFIGKNFDKIVVDPLWPFKILNDGENVLVEVETFFGRERKSPEEISAVLLNQIKKQAESFESCSLTEVVIGIPSEFTEKQKQATLTAAELAGWPIIHFIPESVAAAFAYCSQIQISNNSNIVICDFGGGTLDICVAKLKNEQLQILDSDGDAFLGGRDFDNILFTHFNAILKCKSGNDNIFLPSNKKYLLKEKCQDIKHTLSAVNEATLDVDDFICDSDETITITREEFENLTSHFLVRIQEVIQRALTKANISKNDVNYVFLVGGGCRMPMVQKLLLEIFPKSNHQRNINPEWAVAQGAALYAYYLKNEKNANSSSKIRPLSFFNKLLKNQKK